MRRSCRLALAVLLALLTGGLPLAALAQTYTPPDRGVPGRREGGGTRGGCPAAQPTLTALMPATNFGQTTEAYPAWYWYVPAIEAAAAEFVLLDSSDTEIYRAAFQFDGQPGIISIRLPETIGLPPLAVGEDYRWYFVVSCDLADRSADLYTEGVIQRIEPSAVLASQLAAATPLERAALYAEAGIWYDALGLLARLRQEQPQSPAATQSWAALLESIGLSGIATQPLRP